VVKSEFHIEGSQCAGALLELEKGRRFLKIMANMDCLMRWLSLGCQMHQWKNLHVY